jgi:hypothetical protein
MENMNGMGAGSGGGGGKPQLIRKIISTLLVCRLGQKICKNPGRAETTKGLP